MLNLLGLLSVVALTFLAYSAFTPTLRSSDHDVKPQPESNSALNSLLVELISEIFRHFHHYERPFDRAVLYAEPGFRRLRSGELLPPTQNLDLEKFNPRRHATFSDIAESTGWNGACNFHLPWSKSQNARGDDIWIPRQEAPLDPIHLITLTRSKFIRRINPILRLTNKHYPRITGHCFRIGGTTFYLISGVPPDMVKKFGRWRSQAFLEYWRCLDYFGAIHHDIEMLPLNPDAHRQQRRSLPKA